MAYNFELAISATLSSAIVEEMVKKVVEEQTGKVVASIEPKVRKLTKGIGPAESMETVFDGYRIVFSEEVVEPKASKNIEPDKTFKVTEYN